MHDPGNTEGGARAAVGAILAGGAGSRLGEHKPTADLGGRSLVARAADALAAGGLEPLVVAKPGSSLGIGEGAGAARLLLEPEEPRHPLLGIVTALRAAGGLPVVVLACDLPFVPPALLTWLAEQSDRLIVCEASGRLQPLLGRYEPSLADGLTGALERGNSVREAVRALGPRVIGGEALARFGPPERTLFNVNTPEDLERARGWLSS